MRQKEERGRKQKENMALAKSFIKSDFVDLWFMAAEQIIKEEDDKMN